LEEEALDRTVWRTGLERDCGSILLANCGMSKLNLVVNKVTGGLSGVTYLLTYLLHGAESFLRS